MLIAAHANIGTVSPSVNLGANLLLAANPSGAALSLASSIVVPIF